ncbi:MAG: hypothetical protein HQL28_05265 [Candidatus Omnitrophica bacterium]|nr:hypothetical protein [Candidatus Omnitrophota bacterium]
MLSRQDKDILTYFSRHDFAVTERPFKGPAAELGMTEKALVEALRSLKKRGYIRNLRGVLNQRNAGYKANALVAWNVKNWKGGVEKIIQGTLVADDRVSHCYRRRPARGFNYNLYAMMHAGTKKEIGELAAEVSKRLKAKHTILFTKRELKKEKLKLL